MDSGLKMLMEPILQLLVASQLNKKNSDFGRTVVAKRIFGLSDRNFAAEWNSLLFFYYCYFIILQCAVACKRLIDLQFQAAQNFKVTKLIENSD